MNKRSVPMIAVGFVLVLAGLVGYFLPSPDETPSPRILFENLGGRVIFSHKSHSNPSGDYGSIACATCHHEQKLAVNRDPGQARGPQNAMACGACHGTSEQPDFIAAHQEYYLARGGEACASCHHTRLDGYSELWSHEDHWTYASEDCSACHHEEGKTASSGRLMTGIKPQRCANCHTQKPNPMTARTRKDASHETCRDCHEDLFEAGTKGCATCHGLSPMTTEDAAATIPDDGRSKRNLYSCASCHNTISGRMDAFHASCIGCHDSVGRGPGKEAADCVKCHTP